MPLVFRRYPPSLTNERRTINFHALLCLLAFGFSWDGSYHFGVRIKSQREGK